MITNMSTAGFHVVPWVVLGSERTLTLTLAGRPLTPPQRKGRKLFPSFTLQAWQNRKSGGA